MAEYKLLDCDKVQQRLDEIKPLCYPCWLLVLMMGLSCGCFCKLNGDGWDGFLVTFIASSCAMYIRQILTTRYMNPLINFCVTAFVATIVSGFVLNIPYFSNASTISMAASVNASSRFFVN